MMLSPRQQAIDLIQKGKNILIALPENINGDSLGSALALEAILKILNKKVEVVSSEPVPEKLKFFEGLENLKNKVSSWRDFIISIDTAKNKISRLRYEKENNILKIFLAADQKIEERDIKLETGAFFYDLIITLDAPDLESLGQTFKENTELFFSRPVLNIDHKAANEYFGEVNLVEPTAAACAEIVALLIDELETDLIDREVATDLLAGLIAKTHSFQNTKTTPQALSLASRLITDGAEQEKIIQHLYKTIPLNRLKLWGRLLNQLDLNEQKNIVWFSATPEDFLATQTSPRDLTFLLEEIDDLFPQININIVLWMDETNTVWALIRAKQTEVLQRINSELAGSLKNEKLLLKLTEAGINPAKEHLNALLNSLG
jgi:nanoRNase/pAp phosphatase (c-di-AMP/oligoRNAs hydrolase)